MHRCGSGFLLALAITFVLALTGCLGKSSSNSGNGGVSGVFLSPGGTLSLEVGGTLFFSAAAKDANGKAVLGLDIQFIVASGSPNAAAPLSVAASGAACAGSWDATGAICNPGTPGIALVTAVTNGVSSAVATVYVHEPVGSIQISSITPAGPPPQLCPSSSGPPQPCPCFSQGQTWEYAATVYTAGKSPVDITSTVGPVTWSSSNNGVVAVGPYLNPLQPNVFNLAQTTAEAPGITQLFASVSGTTSIPFPYTTCLIQAIYLQIGGNGALGNSISVNNGGSVPITATAVDTLCGITNNAPLTRPPLTWSTSNPEVAALSGTSNAGGNTAAARNNLGGATLTASCTPPSCDIGLPGLAPNGQLVPSLPIYASDYDPANPPIKNCQPPNLTKAYGTISVNVTSTSAVPTYTAWAATTDCTNQPGCTSALFAVKPGLVPIGSIVSLPRTPNSMMFNSSGRLYIGSNQGLMFANGGSVSAVSNSSTCDVALCGQVLTISNDGNLVVVSDTVSTPSQVYIYNGGSNSTAPVDLTLSNPGETATAAAFSPDQLKLFILTKQGNMYVYSTVDAFAPVQLGAVATDVSFSADGSFAYVAGTPAGSVSAYSTCSLPAEGSQPSEASVEIGSLLSIPPIPPVKLFPSPVIPLPQGGNEWITQSILALEIPPTGSTNESTSIQTLTAEFTQDPIAYQNPLQFTCNPPTIPPFTTPPNPISFSTTGGPVSLGYGNFTPLYSELVADGTEVIIVAPGIPDVLVFNINNGTTASIPLLGSPATGCPQCTGPSMPLSASASTDGSQVYVATCDQFTGKTCTPSSATAGSVHIVNTCGVVACNNPPSLSLGDFQQVPYVNINDANNPNMCNSQGGNTPLCLPNLIALKPQ